MKTYPDQFTPWKPDMTVTMAVTSKEMSDLGISTANGAATMAQMATLMRPAINQVLAIINGGNPDVPRTAGNK